MLRIGLFLATNLAIMIVASITMSLLGLSSNTLVGLLVLCAFFGIGGSLLSLLGSKWTAKNLTGTQVIVNPANESEKWLLDTVKQLAEIECIEMPEVGIFSSPSPNAFATGASRNGALVAVSDSLMKNFTLDEIRAVLAHEIGHVSNGDMVTLTLISGVINTFVMFIARAVASVLSNRSNSNSNTGYYGTVIAIEVVLGFLASMIVMWFSRKREFAADLAGARLAGKNAMIAALVRLQLASEAPQLPDKLVAFGINSKIKQGFMALFMSHPPLEQRIAALRNI